MPVINVSEFLRALVEVLPGTVHAHVSVLLPHLSSRPYQIRQAVVVGLAEVVAAAHEDKTAASEDGENGAAKGGAAAGGGNGGEDESQVQDAVWSECVVGYCRWCGPCFAYVCLGLPPTGAEESWPSCVGGATRSSKPELGRVAICHRATNSVFHSRCSLEPAPAALVLRAHVASLLPVFVVCDGPTGPGREQVQADPRRVRMKDRNRDALLDQLVERALDVSPYVR